MYKYIYLFSIILLNINCTSRKSNVDKFNAVPFAGEQKVAEGALYFTDGRIIPAGIYNFFMVNDSIKRMELTLTLDNIKDCDVYILDGRCDEAFNLNDKKPNYFLNSNPIHLILNKQKLAKISVLVHQLNYDSNHKNDINKKRLIIAKEHKIIACGEIVSNVVKITL